MSLRHTRAIIDAIHSGELERAETYTLPLFGLQVRPQAARWGGAQQGWASRPRLAVSSLSVRACWP
jgi:ATP-dependent phosphoenolpyruvate carboxykinase